MQCSVTDAVLPVILGFVLKKSMLLCFKLDTGNFNGTSVVMSVSFAVLCTKY